jgi:protein TonB
MGPSSTFFLSIDVRHLRAARQRAPRPGAPVRWSWLAFVAAAHAAGIGWLAGSGTDQQHALETVVSVRLIDGEPTNASDASARPHPSAERTVDRAGHPTRPPARATRVEPVPHLGRTREPTAAKQVARSPADVALGSDRGAIPSLPSPAAATAPLEPVRAHDPPAADSEHETGHLAKAIPAVVPGADKAGSSAETSSTPRRPLPARYDAAYLDNPKPDYPAAARRLGEEGTVVLRVHVMRDGRPLEIEIFTTSGSPRLDQAAADAVRRRWRFLPAREGDETIESWLVPIVFRLDS